MKRIAAFAFLLAFTVVLTGDMLAYQVTGTFMYRDREQDHTGFTGNEPLLPIRGADVEVLDNVTSEILATGVTNASGEISINVGDNQTRDIVVMRCTVSGRHGGQFRTLQYDLVDRHDPETGFSAMEKTTAFPAALVAYMQARRLIAPGARPLEAAVPVVQYLDELPNLGVHVQVRG